MLGHGPLLATERQLSLRCKGERRLLKESGDAQPPGDTRICHDDSRYQHEGISPPLRNGPQRSAIRKGSRKDNGTLTELPDRPSERLHAGPANVAEPVPTTIPAGPSVVRVE